MKALNIFGSNVSLIRGRGDELLLLTLKMIQIYTGD